MAWLAAIVVLCIPARAWPERIWCGTSLDPRTTVASPPLAGPAMVTHVDRVRFAAERDPRARSILAAAASECGRAGASWSVTLVVAPSGTVVEANAVGARASCVRDSLRRLHFAPGGIRTMSALLTLARK